MTPNIDFYFYICLTFIVGIFLRWHNTFDIMKYEISAEDV